MTFPPAVPEIPAASIDKAAAYYVNTLGFTFDWGDEPGWHCRDLERKLQTIHHQSPIPRTLRQEWKAAQAKIVSEPEDKPWKLREFLAADLDGNLIRVFYDFRRDI
jgi:hypothetical protein